MPSLLGVLLLSLGVVVLSIFLLGLGSLLRRRCTLRTCGVEGPADGEACDGCPRASQSEPAPSMKV